MRQIFLDGSILEKCGKIWKNCRFSGRLWPDWGNTARVATARLGSIGLNNLHSIKKVKFDLYQQCSKDKNFSQNCYFCIRFVLF